MIAPNSRYPLTRIMSGVIFLLFAFIGVGVLITGITEQGRQVEPYQPRPNGWPFIICGMLIAGASLVVGSLVNVICDIADGIADLRTTTNARRPPPVVHVAPQPQPEPPPTAPRDDARQPLRLAQVLPELRRIATMPADEQHTAKTCLAQVIRLDGLRATPDETARIIADATGQGLLTHQEAGSLRTLLTRA